MLQQSLVLFSARQRCHNSSKVTFHLSTAPRQLRSTRGTNNKSSVSIETIIQPFKTNAVLFNATLLQTSKMKLIRGVTGELCCNVHTSPKITDPLMSSSFTKLCSHHTTVTNLTAHWLVWAPRRHQPGVVESNWILSMLNIHTKSYSQWEQTFVLGKYKAQWFLSFIIISVCFWLIVLFFYSASVWSSPTCLPQQADRRCPHVASEPADAPTCTLCVPPLLRSRH